MSYNEEGMRRAAREYHQARGAFRLIRLDGAEAERINAAEIAGCAPNASNNIRLDAIALDKDKVAELAKLKPLEYDRVRELEAEQLGARVSTLDVEVKKARAQEGTQGQGRALDLPEPEPWPGPVDGAVLLSDIVSAVTSHVVMPAAGADAFALWVIHTHAADAFTITPRLAIMSPEKQCGKTTLLDVLACLVRRPLPTANASMSGVFRAVEMAQPTLLLDEADRFVTNQNDELLGILNSGHRKGGSVLRTVGDDHEPRMFSTFAPCAFALIGRLPDTLEDRSVIIELRRRTSDEAVTLFRLDRTEHLHVLARKAVRWAADNIEKLRTADPNVGELFNRVADNWRPLLAIADLAGGDWPKRARHAATSAAKRDLENSIGVELLADIQAIFAEKKTDRLPSGDLAEALAKIEGRPWAEWGRTGKQISQNALARLLKKFKTSDDLHIAPGNIRVGEQQTPKGYYLAQFEDAFTRYLSNTPLSQPPHRHKPTAMGTSAISQPPQAQIAVAVGKCEKPNNDGPCGGVAVVKPPPKEKARVEAPTKAGNGRAISNTLDDRHPPDGGVPDFLRRCDHCGQPGRKLEPLAPYDWRGREVRLHPRCEAAWAEGAMQ